MFLDLCGGCAEISLNNILPAQATDYGVPMDVPEDSVDTDEVYDGSTGKTNSNQVRV